MFPLKGMGKICRDLKMIWLRINLRTCIFTKEKNKRIWSFYRTFSIMLFYVCEIPNNSVFDIDIMEDLVMKRYEYYSNNQEYDKPIEYDKASHFIMCLVANKSTLMHDMIVRGETKLFSEKLNQMKKNDIMINIEQSLNFLNFIDQAEEYSSAFDKFKTKFKLLRKILSCMLDKGDHAFHKKHDINCKKIEMHVPFTFVTNLVAKREIEITQGWAKIPCGKWNLILNEIFKFFLGFEIKFFNEFHILKQVIFEKEDNRLRNLIDNCMMKMSGKVSLVEDLMSASDIDKKCLYFPPCISNLHQILRQTHRLSYDSRYQYTLFLRDIGLPVRENISFWKNEYTKPYLGSSCTHFWEDKISRYEYQIYHMYGLIGSRIKKTSHSCEKFINKLTLRMDGGCPFAHLNRNALLNSLPRVLPETDVEDILNYKSQNCFQKACAVYLCSQKNYLQNMRLDSERQNQASDKKNTISEILSPVHYYYLARGIRKT